MLFVVSSVYAETLSASKTLTTQKYYGAYMQTMPQVKCPNTGTFYGHLELHLIMFIQLCNILFIILVVLGVDLKQLKQPLIIGNGML